MKMLSLKPATLGAALLGTAASAMTLMAAPAQAGVFVAGDSLALSGEGEILTQSDGSRLIQFFDPTLPFTSTDSETNSADFDISESLVNFVLSTEAQFGDVINDILLSSAGSYSAAANPWISLTATYIGSGGPVDGKLELFLNTGAIDMQLLSGSVFEFDLAGIFDFSPSVGSSSANVIGEFTVNVSRRNDVFNIVATTKNGDNTDPFVVPEPLTMLGAGTAVLFGGAFKRQLNKKDKKGSTKA